MSAELSMFHFGDGTASLPPVVLRRLPDAKCASPRELRRTDPRRPGDHQHLVPTDSNQHFRLTLWHRKCDSRSPEGTPGLRLDPWTYLRVHASPTALPKLAV